MNKAILNLQFAHRSSSSHALFPSGLSSLAYCFIFAWCLLAGSSALLAAPLSLHPENPHYFLYGGKPIVLITSGEHYGAVLNFDFNYNAYLDELRSKKLNLTRTFTGAYLEPMGAFNIANNTLAPALNRFICPWARSDTPGYAGGGGYKFDLTQWDDAYFRRLQDFVRQAGRRGIIVELNLFCPFYEESQWNLSPQKASNNINGIGAISRTNVYTLDKNGGLLAVHKALVRKIVKELMDFDNLYYEICNEPYFGGVTPEWQREISATIVDTENYFSVKHLISQNIANGSKKIDDPDPAVSIFNFHYATPPAAVALNYQLNKVIGDNETGFKGTNDFPYRREGWAFILAGGGLYNNLDYSFAVNWEDGTFIYPTKQPGGGNPEFRRQMKILQEFISSFDFIRMKPANSIIEEGLPENGSAWALVEPGKAYAIYLSGGKQATLGLSLPAGKYRAEWLNPLTGNIEKKEKLNHPGGRWKLSSPPYSEDIALRIKGR